MSQPPVEIDPTVQVETEAMAASRAITDLVG
jgi:hypothetical protein